MNTFLFIPTMKCNLSCPVCHFKVKNQREGYTWIGYNKEHKIEEELKWYEWMVYLNRFRPYHLELTGGEPTIYPGIEKLIAHIPGDSTWAMTTNGMTDISKWCFSRCRHITISYHGIKERFEDNVRRLKDKVPMSISFVVEKDKVKQRIEEASIFVKQKYQVNMLRELNQGVDWTEGNEWEELKNYTKKGFRVVEDDIPPRYEFDKGFLCMGGANYFTAMPDGRVYRCYSDAMVGNGMGHIKSFEPYHRPKECYLPCLACALDFKFRLKKIKGEKNEKVTV